MLFGGNSWPSIAFKLWMMLWQLWWWSNVVAVVLPVETALSTIGTGDSSEHSVDYGGGLDGSGGGQVNCSSLKNRGEDHEVARAIFLSLLMMQVWPSQESAATAASGSQEETPPSSEGGLSSVEAVGNSGEDYKAESPAYDYGNIGAGVTGYDDLHALVKPVLEVVNMSSEDQHFMMGLLICQFSQQSASTPLHPSDESKRTSPSIDSPPSPKGGVLRWDDLSDLDRKVLLEVDQGPQRMAKGSAVSLTIYYCFLFTVGVPGNLLTCLIICTNSYMRTPSNFFLVSLALTDLLSIIYVIPMEILLIWRAYPWPFGDFGCKMLTVASELVTHVSIFTMIVFTFERYIAICHPFRTNLRSGRRRSIYIIVATWIVGLIPSIAWTLFTRVEHGSFAGEIIEESAICVLAPHQVNQAMTYFTAFSSFGLYVVPVIVLPVVYSRIAAALKSSEALRMTQPVNAYNNTVGNRKTVVRMQMAVIFCFLICWTPYHLQRIAFVIVNSKHWFKVDSTHIDKFQENVHILAGCSMHLSSAINPFLYSLLSKRFRRGFHDLKRRYIYPLLGKRVVTVPVSNPNNLSFRGHPRLLRMRGAALRHFRRHSWGDMVNTGEAAVDKVDGGATSGHEMRRLRDYTLDNSSSNNWQSTPAGGAVTPSAVTKTTPLRSSQFRQSRLTKQKDRGGGGGGGGVGNELTVSPAGGDTAGDIVHSEGGHLSDSNLRQQMPLAARSVAPFHLRRSPIVRLTGGGSSGDNTNGTTSPAGIDVTHAHVKRRKAKHPKHLFCAMTTLRRASRHINIYADGGRLSSSSMCSSGMEIDGRFVNPNSCSNQGSNSDHHLSPKTAGNRHSPLANNVPISSQYGNVEGVASGYYRYVNGTGGWEVPRSILI